MACVPNIQHWSILVGLLRGRWEYEDEGLLDRTHLRFFTIEGLHPLCSPRPGCGSTTSIPGRSRTISSTPSCSSWDPVAQGDGSGREPVRDEDRRASIHRPRLRSPIRRLAHAGDPDLDRRAPGLRPRPRPRTRPVPRHDPRRPHRRGDRSDQARERPPGTRGKSSSARGTSSPMAPQIDGQAALARLNYLIVSEFDDDPRHFSFGLRESLPHLLRLPLRPDLHRGPRRGDSTSQPPCEGLRQSARLASPSSRISRRRPPHPCSSAPSTARPTGRRSSPP